MNLLKRVPHAYQCTLWLPTEVLNREYQSGVLRQSRPQMFILQDPQTSGMGWTHPQESCGCQILQFYSIKKFNYR
jgi:hypothetical protein